MKYFAQAQFKIISAMLLLVSTSAMAQEATVVKVKGQQAIVKFPDGMKPQLGQTLNIADCDSHGGSDGPGKRNWVLDLSTTGNPTFLKYSSSTSTVNGASSTSTFTGLQVSGRGGWNTGVMEYGPMGTLEFASVSGTGTTQTFEVGGFFDYNLVPNRDGVDLVYGGAANLQVGEQTTQTTFGAGTTTNTANIFSLFGGGQVKWFPFKHAVAVRGEGGINFAESNATVSTTTFAVLIDGGISVYF